MLASRPMGRESIRAAAVALPEDERAKLASELLASVEDYDIDDQAEVDAAWACELELRASSALAIRVW